MVERERERCTSVIEVCDEDDWPLMVVSVKRGVTTAFRRSFPSTL